MIVYYSGPFVRASNTGVDASSGEVRLFSSEIRRLSVFLWFVNGLCVFPTDVRFFLIIFVHLGVIYLDF